MDSLNNTEEETLAEEAPPLTGTVAGMRKLYSGCLSEQELADAYFIADNTFWWVEDDIYDYEEGTPEYNAAVKTFEEWLALSKEYESKIFTIQ